MPRIKSILLLACLLCYTSAQAIWLSPDPLSDKYPYISSYAYCNWNPIGNIDPDGMYFDEANEIIAQKIEDKCLQKLSSRVIDDNRKNELNKTLQDVKDMRNDKKYEYRFEQAQEDGCKIEYAVEKGGNKVITMFSDIKNMDGTVAHEARHGGQVARGEMFYNPTGNPQNYGVKKEVDAYKAQWGWDGYLRIYGISASNNLPGILNPNYDEINPTFVNSITAGLTYTLVYPPQNYNMKIWNNH